MKQGNKMGVLAKMLSTFGYEGVDHNLGVHSLEPRDNRNERRRTQRSRAQRSRQYKSAVCGTPRGSQPCGSVPAPTLDQVRRLEREFGQRLRVKMGVCFFKSDDVMFTRDEAAIRQHDDAHEIEFGCRPTPVT